MSFPSPIAPPEAPAVSLIPKAKIRPNWTDEENAKLVEIVNEVGLRKWTVVESRMKDEVYTRTARAIEQHYMTLKTRAEAQGGPLVGSVTLRSFTLDEDLNIFALSTLNESIAAPGSSSKSKGSRPVDWSTFASLFPGRGSYDLIQRLGMLKQRRKESDGYKQLEEKKGEAMSKIKERFLHLDVDVKSVSSKRDTPSGDPSSPSASPLKKRKGLTIALRRPSQHFSTSLSHSNSSSATSSDPASDSLGATPLCSRAEGDKKTPKEEKLKAPEHDYKPYVEGMRALRNLRRALAEE